MLRLRPHILQLQELGTQTPGPGLNPVLWENFINKAAAYAIQSTYYTMIVSSQTQAIYGQ